MQKRGVSSSFAARDDNMNDNTKHFVKLIMSIPPMRRHPHINKLM